MNKFYIFFLCTILTHVSFGQDSLKAQTGRWATELNINPFNGGELSLNNVDGIDLGETSILLLEKTEELTLYMIELDERLRKLEKQNTRQK